MWQDETDTTQLAQRLRVGPRELIETIGGPWHVAPRIEEREAESPGTLFVGRAGPSVGILVGEGTDPLIRIGRAVGQWQGVADLAWSIVDEAAPVPTPVRTAAAVDIDEFLVDLGAVVDEVFSAARSTLVLCRYCGRIVSPVHASADQMCSACAEHIFGLVH